MLKQAPNTFSLGFQVFCVFFLENSPCRLVSISLAICVCILVENRCANRNLYAAGLLCLFWTLECWISVQDFKTLLTVSESTDWATRPRIPEINESM